MKVAMTDNQLRAALIAAGRLDAVHALEATVSRDRLADRAEYRAGLETLCREAGLPTREAVPSRARATVIPYGAG